MPFAIVLIFDEKSTLILEKIFTKFREFKIGSMHYEDMKPHITLTNYNTLDIKTAKDRLTLFSIENNQFEIQLNSIGYFPTKESVIFLNPKTTGELLTIQQKIFRLFKEFESDIFPETWVPHCTLGMHVQNKDIAHSFDIIKEQVVFTKEKPFCVIAEALSLVKYQKEPPNIDWWLDYKLK